VTAELANSGTAPALAAKLTAVDERGQRVLPVYYSDNYVTLLPGTTRKIEIRCPANGPRCARLELRGWNVQPMAVQVTASSQQSAKPATQ
jgi:hypothetical protein